MNQQEALVKLAQVRMAINHVLRMRAMQKQAAGPEPRYDYNEPISLQRPFTFGDNIGDGSRGFVQNVWDRDGLGSLYPFLRYNMPLEKKPVGPEPPTDYNEPISVHKPFTFGDNIGSGQRGVVHNILDRNGLGIFGDY